ncbi:hypothetical protein SDC9_144839 [bioreactor metagenome]|uniref:Uncharacterized protein n=1 Tax=bioreactor metagenome TaxID=1076179 RepID=A0A645EAL7_9ZZZZ
MFLYTHQRASLDIVIPTIGNQIFKCRPCSRKELYFIKNNQRLPLIELHIVQVRKIQKERIQIIEVMNEQIHDLFTGTVEINYDIALVLSLCKCFNYIAFPNTAGTFNEQGRSPHLLLLPLQFCKYLSFHRIFVPIITNSSISYPFIITDSRVFEQKLYLSRKVCVKTTAIRTLPRNPYSDFNQEQR